MLKLFTSPGSRWPEVLPGTRQSDIWSAYLELVRCERQHPRNGQEAQLIDMLQHCANNVPYYRDRWQHGTPWGLHQLQQLPILTRDELARNLDLLTADKLPSGHMIIGSAFTSGSTGTPVEIKRTNVTTLWHNAMYLRCLEWAGFNPELSMAAIRYYEPKIAKELQRGLQQPYFESAFAGFLKMGVGYVMDVHVDPILQMKWLREVKSDYLVSYPSNLMALVHQNIDQQLSLKGVLSVSEELHEEEQAEIGKSFSCTVVNSYSSHEVGYIATPCERTYQALKGCLHVYEENVVLEIVDEQGKRCPPGEYGRVLLTTLHNYATPLVRYDIGDRAAWYPHGQCDCGRPHRLIERPQGKRHPLFTLPSGAKKNSMGIAAGLRRIGGMRQFRVTQKTPTRVLVEFVPVIGSDGWNADRHEAAQALLREFFESQELVQSHFSSYNERVPLLMSGKSPHLVTEVP